MAQYGQSASSGVVAAQVVGLTTAAYTAGLSGAFSLIAIPSIKIAPPQLAARQWQVVFGIGKVAMPPLALVSATIFASLAYREPKQSPRTPFYMAAAVLIPSMIPYTIFAMLPTNEKIAAIAASTKPLDIAQERATMALLDKWALLNLGRSALFIVGTACAAYAIFRKEDSPKLAR